MTLTHRLRMKTGGVAPLAIGGWAAAVGAVPDTNAKLLLAGPVLSGAAAWWIILTPERWPLFIGASFIASVIFLRGGIFRYLVNLWENVRPSYVKS